MAAERDTPAPAPRWAVVGGGMLGLTLALRLAQAGRRVTVIEAAPQLGGLAGAWQLGDVTWDRHYHVTLLSDRHLRRLLAELALDADMAWTRTRTGFYAGGRLHPLSNALDYLRLPVLGLTDKLRLAATILYAARIEDPRPLEHELVEPWLVRLSGRRTFERLWRPLLRAKLGENYHRTAAAFIWATIRRLYAARHSGLKHEMFGYLPGGYARLLGRFAAVLERHGVAIELSRPVARLEPTPGGLVDVRFQDGGERLYDHAVITTAAPLAARLCPALTPAERRCLEAVPYQGIVCASLLLDRPLSDNYLTYITDDGVPFTAVVEMSALVDRAAFGGRSLVYLPKYVATDDPFLHASDPDIESAFLAALARMHPHFRPEHVRAFRVSRVREVMPIPTLGYADRLPPMATSVPGVHIVSSAHIVHGTLNVNETVGLAERAAGALLAAEAAAVPVPPDSRGDRHDSASLQAARQPVARPG